MVQRMCQPNCIQGSKGEKAQEKAMMEIVEKLNLTYMDMKKAIAVCTKVLEFGLGVDAPSTRLKDATEALQALLEYVETCHSDLGWTIKFRKDKLSKTPLNLTIAQNIQKKSAEALGDMLEASKACKALLPKSETA